MCSLTRGVGQRDAVDRSQVQDESGMPKTGMDGGRAEAVGRGSLGETSVMTA